MASGRQCHNVKRQEKSDGGDGNTDAQAARAMLLAVAKVLADDGIWREAVGDGGGRR